MTIAPFAAVAPVATAVPLAPVAVPIAAIRAGGVIPARTPMATTVPVGLRRVPPQRLRQARPFHLRRTHPRGLRQARPRRLGPALQVRLRASPVPFSS
ncbi:hypothetical protein [Streptomyces griseus]